MPITYNIELNSKPDSKGRSSVFIRLHLKGQKPGRVLTTVRIENASKYWSPKQKWTRWIIGHPNREALNQEILNEHDRIKKQVQAWQDAETPGAILTPGQLAERFRAGSSDLYFDWVDQVLDDVKEQAYATYIGKRSAVNAFKSWAGETLPLASVTPVLVRSFQDYLVKTPMAYGGKRKGSTINKMLNRLHIIHQSVLVKTGVSPKKASLLSPWTDIDDLAELRPRKAKLTETTIQNVAALTVDTTRRRVTPVGAFQIWMLEHVLAGMRFSDVLFLRYQNFTTDQDGQPIHLRYEMLKTGNVVSIPILDEGRALLKRYWNEESQPTAFILPYLDSSRPYAKIITHEQYKAASFDVKRRLYNDLAHWNRQVNLCLREVRTVAGLPEKLTNHSARHSFADLARRIMEQDVSLSMYDIQKMLGHNSIITTEVYTKDLQEPDSTKPMFAIFSRKD
ncbi:tyrosine-type recombinase/integrase [Spirosoma linguale]|uniref:Integrase family protein n=1 Tax=Spirosoma linguale (strain ATCC 33905 / DSM 74 / LMG 10896 / Claus 1) TaxID=504472 RepID=D2QNB3_SPILD|nr:integrase family protein [Spirosoma linguale DSM 74]